MDIVVDYVITYRYGELSVKLIYSSNPAKALIDYYEHEKRGESNISCSMTYEA